MFPANARIRWGGVAGGVGSSRGLETHWFPRAVPIKRYDLKRLGLKGELSPGSGEGQASRKIESRTSYFEGRMRIPGHPDRPFRSIVIAHSVSS